LILIFTIQYYCITKKKKVSQRIFEDFFKPGNLRLAFVGLVVLGVLGALILCAFPVGLFFGLQLII